ncbi:hypothetical protein QCA50_005702 [Cerrena zonata]|uniref:BZIP domain-containing protein n=1 Tax=Cerrena zonata TaxID=2478898 RepID=A0AAW0GK23_9APHY
MSSKRGRKRNDNLPPNRARDVQRAFRARRAAHLEALEQRVAELEEENNVLRAALHLPPVHRPALGKGPTGKDKPKPYPTRTSSSLGDIIARSGSLPSGVPAPAGSDSPSSNSARTDSLSPTTNSIHDLGVSSVWGDNISRKDTSNQQQYDYAGLSTGSNQYYQASQSPSTSRPLHSVPQATYQTTSDGNYFLENQRGYPVYSSVHDNSHSQMHNHSPTSAIAPSSSPHGNSVTHTMSTHRRSITESQGYPLGVVINHQALSSSMPHAPRQQQQQSAHVVRIPSPESVVSVRASVYDMESRVGRMPS